MAFLSIRNLIGSFLEPIPRYIRSKNGKRGQERRSQQLRPTKSRGCDNIEKKERKPGEKKRTFATRMRKVGNCFPIRYCKVCN